MRGLALLALLLLPLLARAELAPPKVIYRSPSPAARYVRPETNLLWRFDQRIEGAPPSVIIYGSRSGSHAGRSSLVESGRELIFQPSTPFVWGETVTVKLGRGEEMEFTIAAGPASRASVDLEESSPDLLAPAGPDTLPIGFPEIQCTIYGTPAPGRLFLTSSGGTSTPYLLILRDSGDPVFYRAMSSRCADFKVQPNGLLTYFANDGAKFYALDSTYALVDSFACGNGYTTDAHDLRILPDGHVLLMSYDPQIVDMSTVVPGGKPAATVTGLVIQELDPDKNVVFQWRSWDHFEVTDATHEDLTAAAIDYVHGNALEVDADGNFLLSSRHMDEITKIDRVTGDILWRWGGKHDQFTWSGDTLKFSHQHAIRQLPNGHFTLFDNGNFHTPSFSRAVEYQVDESAHTANLVWQYRHTPDVYGSATGYVQRLANGNTLIAWGNGKPNMTEVTPAGEMVMEMSLPAGQSTYRVLRQDWMPDADTTQMATPGAIALSPSEPNPFRDETVMFVTLAEPTPVTVQVFDVAGREVRNVVSRVAQSAGVFRVDIDLAGYASGIYFCRVSTQAGAQSQRIVHLN
jgi:hypothetical protein